MGSRLSEQVRSLAGDGVRVACRPLGVGLESPPDTAFLGVVNHPTALDRGLLLAVLERPVTFTDLMAEDAADSALAALAAGESVIAFVEGHRAPDAAVYRGVPATADLVLGTDAPVIPMAIRGPVDARGWFSLLGAAGPEVAIGKPLDLERHRLAHARAVADSDTRFDAVVRRTVVDTVMHAIVQLSGRPYVDVDASLSRSLQRQHERRARQERAAAARIARQEAEQARERARVLAEQDAREAAEEQVWAERAAREQAQRAAVEDERRLALLRAERAEARRSGPASS